MVSLTLAQLEAWYNEPTAGPERPKLLSKLAILELCGWLETEQDKLILNVSNVCLKDAPWTQKEIVDRNFGFDYNRHFRPMLAQILGEHLTRKLEQVMDIKHPGSLDEFRSSTGDLWVKRCNFAHENLTTSVIKQQKFDAPSWCQNWYRVLNKALSRLEAEALVIAQAL